MACVGSAGRWAEDLKVLILYLLIPVLLRVGGGWPPTLLLALNQHSRKFTSPAISLSPEGSILEDQRESWELEEDQVDMAGVGRILWLQQGE